MSIETTERTLDEGNNNDMPTIDVCITLDDIQAGLMRELVYTVSPVLETAGKVTVTCIYTYLLILYNIIDIY